MNSQVEAVKSIDWNSWFYNPGMPPYKVIYGEKFMKVIFFKCIWEIRTDNPSLAVKSLNVPLDQS